MTTSNSLYDAPTREIYLLENVPIQGRKTELRQLLKLLNLAKAGQPKAALITGDAGIGKSALLASFTNLVREGIYCRILDLGKMTYDSPEALYAGIIDALRADADEILDEALLAVNEITQELDLHWERQDLIRAIALVKLQESIGGKDAISQDQLVKAIRSQVPAIKKLKFSVNESIEKLVDLIVNPWVMVATSLLNPMSPQLKEAIELADILKGGMQKEEPSTAASRQSTNELPPVPEQDEAAEETVSASEAIVHLESSQGASAYKQISTQAPEHEDLGPLTPIRLDAPPKPIKDPLIRHLMTIFTFVNAAIAPTDSALLITIDEWDRILETPNPNALKEFLAELLYQVTEQKNYHYMAVITARTEGESYTLGGSLYNHFRTKLLLDALSENICRKLVRTPMQQLGVEVDESVHRQLYQLSKGNPFWHLKLLNYLQERVESNRVKHVDLDFFDRLAVNEVSSLLELSFTRLKLAFLNDEDSLYKVIAALLKEFDEHPFSANQAIKEISTAQGFTDGYVFEVLRALYRHDFIRETEARPVRQTAGQPRLLEDRSRKAEPVYVVQSRFVMDFLKDKTRAIETDISTDEKLMYLKKIIPLSVKSGELDREKTMEVLALSDAMGRPEMVQFLENLFVDYLQDDKPVVRVTALNNVALIDSQRAREALFKAMRDEDSMVREYAARNLALLSQKSNDPTLAERIVDTMLNAIDDDSEAVRAQVYSTLAKYRWHRDLTSVFIKGMSDACDTVRLTSAKNLAEMDSDSPFVFASLLDATDDEVTEVRRYACIGLQNHQGPEAIDAIVTMLQHDSDSGIRALAADSLSRMSDPKAFEALVNALRHEASEDVKLAVARALGKRRGWQTEEILLEALHNTDPDEMPVFVWACVRSLGQVGGTERSISTLNELQGRLTNPILVSVVELARAQIATRIDELRQIERQLEEATPMAVAVPSEYEEDVVVPEEEVPLVLSSLAEHDVVEEGDMDPDDDIIRQAELAQLELNPSHTGVSLPFEKKD